MKTLKSMGIKLTHNSRHGWVAGVDFSTMEHCKPDCIEGHIGTTYFSANLAEVVDRAMAAAEQAGIVFVREDGISPAIYVEGDGEGEGQKLPQDWRALVGEQCKRLGWSNVYEA